MIGQRVTQVAVQSMPQVGDVLDVPGPVKRKSVRQTHDVGVRRSLPQENLRRVARDKMDEEERHGADRQ